MPKEMKALLRMMKDKTASDLHITSYSPAQLRIDEKLVDATGDTLSPEDTMSLA